MCRKFETNGKGSPEYYNNNNNSQSKSGEIQIWAALPLQVSLLTKGLYWMAYIFFFHFFLVIDEDDYKFFIWHKVHLALLVTTLRCGVVQTTELEKWSFSNDINNADEGFYKEKETIICLPAWWIQCKRKIMVKYRDGQQYMWLAQHLTSRISNLVPTVLVNCPQSQASPCHRAMASWASPTHHSPWAWLVDLCLIRKRKKKERKKKLLSESPAQPSSPHHQATLSHPRVI